MLINDYNQLGSMELDTLKEIGSIGTGNAATALGMKKMDKDQVVYIQVNDKDAAITSNGDKVVSNE